MINIVFKRKNDMLVSFIIKGHADRKAKSSEKNYDNYDSETDMIYDDVVCGAVSLLGQVCLIGIEEVIKLKVDCTVEEGYIALSLENLTSSEIEKTKVLMETTLLGLKNLQLTYGEYIKLEEV
ncbi:ribosomal-processing cysteine protease Prp [Clostridium hydrogenum]|uniref:ribosomal-processing cysteine protease Prp n=1 Tax=Clostridium hydrogenum TaxID=2855764 RepID=UPI001F2F4294|nr:ribosomal-processing cysteine protease Prp [Clostridium hydrogenum]